MPDGVDYASVEVEVGLLWHALTLPAAAKSAGDRHLPRVFDVLSRARASGARRRFADQRRPIDPEPRNHLWIDTPLADIIRYIPKTSQDAAPEFAARLRVVRDNARGDGGPALRPVPSSTSGPPLRHHHQRAIAFEPMLEVGGHISCTTRCTTTASGARSSNSRFRTLRDR